VAGAADQEIDVGWSQIEEYQHLKLQGKTERRRFPASLKPNVLTLTPVDFADLSWVVQFVKITGTARIGKDPGD
jgi:hypothetical protein